MMSQLCLLAIGVLCLPLGCLGGLSQCANEIDTVGGGPPTPGINNYKAYRYESVIAGDCNNLEVTCVATILPDANLRGRTWFITNIRPNYGLFYDNNTIHDFRVQCPAGTFLHLVVQNSSLPVPIPGTPCTSVDFVRIGAVGILTDEVNFCGDNNFVQTDPSISETLYNNGRGRIFPDGSANISFCSNNVAEPGQFNGFVIRATCLDPAEYQLPGCTDLGFFRAWDPGFTDQIFNEFAEVDKIALPHKKRRSISWAMKQMQREKRFTGRQESLDLTAGVTVTYNNYELRVMSDLADTEDIVLTGITCFISSSSLVGTRFFFGDAPLTFFGPGRLDYTRSFATLIYTIPQDMIESTFLPGTGEAEVANIIYEHIFNNWIFPYPVIDNTERRATTFPILSLPSGSNPPQFPDLDIPGYRNVESLGFVQEDIQSGNNTGDCKRAIRIEVAPSINARMPAEIVRFCQFFDKACDLALKTACREALRLDPLSVGK